MRLPYSVDPEISKEGAPSGERARSGRGHLGLVEKKTGCEIVEGGVCIDRVRVCLRIPPKCAVSDVMGCLKGKSALALCDRHPEWRSRIGRDRTFWARGYYVSTVGLNEAAVRKYIADQEDGSRFER